METSSKPVILDCMQQQLWQSFVSIHRKILIRFKKRLACLQKLQWTNLLIQNIPPIVTTRLLVSIRDSPDRSRPIRSIQVLFLDQIVLSRLVEGCDPAYLSADGMKVLIKAMKLLDQAKDSYDIELIAAATGHVASLLRLKSSGVAKEWFHDFKH